MRPGILGSSFTVGLFFGSLCTGVFTPASGQTLAGRLLDTSTETAIPLSRVTLTTPEGDPVVFTFTDPQGFFALTAPEPGSYLINAEALFYWTYTEGPVGLEASDTLMVEFGLTPHPSELEGIVVEARSRPLHLIMNGYYERAKSGLGYHLDRTAIARHSFTRTSDILFTVPGVKLLEVSFGDKEPIFSRSQFWGSLNSGGAASACFPSLYLDGVLWSWGGENPTEVDRILPPEEIEAMEIYTSPQEVPPRFAGVSSQCGVIAVWSKNRE